MQPLQKKFQRGTVLVNDDGGSVRFLLPHPSAAPTELTDEAKVSFDALQVKYVTLEQRPIASEGLGADTNVIVPKDVEFFSLEKFQEKFDILKKQELVNYNLILAIPRGMDVEANKDQIVVWMENPSVRNRVEIAEG